MYADFLCLQVTRRAVGSFEVRRPTKLALKLVDGKIERVLDWSHLQQQPGAGTGAGMAASDWTKSTKHRMRRPVSTHAKHAHPFWIVWHKMRRLCASESQPVVPVGIICRAFLFVRTGPCYWGANERTSLLGDVCVHVTHCLLR